MACNADESHISHGYPEIHSVVGSPGRCNILDRFIIPLLTYRGADPRLYRSLTLRTFNSRRNLRIAPPIPITSRFRSTLVAFPGLHLTGNSATR
ncbi:MAG: hypothetical protein C5S49_03060 [Candidatus Methanogaster sp.]|nr:MAG: hypothetical protein C5S49_03060 [ANME-2 cluster archaeon]